MIAVADSLVNLMDGFRESTTYVTNIVGIALQ